MNTQAVSKGRKTASVVIMGLIFVGGAYAWIDDALKPDALVTKPAVAADWDDLVLQYRGNALAFNEKYNGKAFNMSGVVGKVADSLSGPNVTAASDAGTAYDSIFTTADESKLAKLHPGDTITYTCESFDLGLQMDDCRLVSVKDLAAQ